MNWWENDPVATPKQGNRWWENDPTAKQSSQSIFDVLNTMANGKPQLPPMTRAQAAGEGFQQGASFGLSDEMAANNAASQVRDRQLGERLRASQTAQPITSDEEARQQFMREYEAKQAREAEKAGAYNQELTSQRRDLSQAREQYPVTAFGAEVLGAIPTAIMGTPKLVQAGAPLLKRAGQSALEAGIGGAVYGFNTGEGGAQDRAKNAAISAAISAPIGAAAPVLGDKVKRFIDNRNVANASQSLDDLRALKNEAYKEVERLGVRYSPKGFNDFADDLTQRVQGMRISERRHDKAFDMLNEINQMRGSAPTIEDLDNLRQVIYRDVASSNDLAQRNFGQEMIQSLDNFIDNASTAQVTTGDPAKAATAIRQARELHRRLRKGELLDRKAYQAELRAAGSGSGGNVNNALRQRIGDVLLSERMRKGYRPNEIAAMERVVKGTPAQNALRMASVLSPNKGGLSLLLNLGGVAVAPQVALPLGAAGFVAKQSAENMTKSAVRKALMEVVSGGKGAADPVIQQIIQKQGAQTLSPAKQAIIEALMRRQAPASGSYINQSFAK